MKDKNQKKSFLKRFFSKKAAASVGTAVKVLTSVVLGAAMLAGTYGVVKTGVIPTTEAKVSSMYEVSDVITTGGSVSDDIQVQYEMLNGSGQTYTAGQATPLSFRSSAPMSTFKGVKVDDATVDPVNYEVTEGSTIVTFTPEYSEALSEGEHTVAILSEGGSATATFTAEAGYNHDAPELHPSGTIPERATYTAANGTVYNAGDTMPTTVTNGDIYTYGDYKYTYKTSSKGWKVEGNYDFVNITPWQESYGDILETINGKSITDISNLFDNCCDLIVSPEIPNGVTNMNSTFQWCSKLQNPPLLPNGVTNLNNTFAYCGISDLSNYIIPNTVTVMSGTFVCSSLTIAPIIPNNVTNINSTFEDCSLLRTYTGSTDADGDFSNYVIPNSVTSMQNTFSGCTLLTTAPSIPNSVINMSYTFCNCTALTGNIEINANPTSWSYCFNGTVKPITLTGSSTKLSVLAGTATKGNVTY